ncbi:MAG: hypothetical protein H2069_07855 [Legionella sp.]|nr:hypothetical protein [Legionella sp.]
MKDINLESKQAILVKYYALTDYKKYFFLIIDEINANISKEDKNKFLVDFLQAGVVAGKNLCTEKKYISYLIPLLTQRDNQFWVYTQKLEVENLASRFDWIIENITLHYKNSSERKKIFTDFIYYCSYQNYFIFSNPSEFHDVLRSINNLDIEREDKQRILSTLFEANKSLLYTGCSNYSFQSEFYFLQEIDLPDSVKYTEILNLFEQGKFRVNIADFLILLRNLKKYSSPGKIDPLMSGILNVLLTTSVSMRNSNKGYWRSRGPWGPWEFSSVLEFLNQAFFCEENSPNTELELVQLIQGMIESKQFSLSSPDPFCNAIRCIIALNLAEKHKDKLLTDCSSYALLNLDKHRLLEFMEALAKVNLAPNYLKLILLPIAEKFFSHYIINDDINLDNLTQIIGKLPSSFLVNYKTVLNEYIIYSYNKLFSKNISLYDLNNAARSLFNVPAELLPSEQRNKYYRTIISKVVYQYEEHQIYDYDRSLGSYFHSMQLIQEINIEEEYKKQKIHKINQLILANFYRFTKNFDCDDLINFLRALNKTSIPNKDNFIILLLEKFANPDFKFLANNEEFCTLIETMESTLLINRVLLTNKLLTAFVNNFILRTSCAVKNHEDFIRTINLLHNLPCESKNENEKLLSLFLTQVVDQALVVTPRKEQFYNSLKLIESNLHDAQTASTVSTLHLFIKHSLRCNPNLSKKEVITYIKHSLWDDNLKKPLITKFQSPVKNKYESFLHLFHSKKEKAVKSVTESKEETSDLTQEFKPFFK